MTDTHALLETKTLSSLEEAQALSNDLKRLMAGVEKASLKTEVKAHVERLNGWAETYAKGLSAAQKLSDQGVGSLQETQKELSLALEEYLRLEDEGGATPDQSRQTDDLAQALKRINKLIPAIEHNFALSPSSLPASADSASHESPATGVASAIKAS